MVIKEKRIMIIRFSFRITGILLTALVLFSCGQKGPLYIQDDVQKQEQQKVSEPVSESLSQETEKPVKK